MLVPGRETLEKSDTAKQGTIGETRKNKLFAHDTPVL